MKTTPISRRRTLQLASLIAFATLLPGGARADAPAPSPVTPDLVAAAAKEGRVVFYTAMDLQVAEALGKGFEAKYPGIVAQVERSGAERIFQRIGQENSSNIHVADVVDSSDVAHLLAWKRDGLLAAYVPADVARYPTDERDPDGFYATNRATLSCIGYNTKLVKPGDAPKSYADLLDPKWKGKMVKAHPGYSGNIVTATFELSRALGWDFFEKLGKQRVLQVQSSTEPPKKLALGERPVMVDGNEYNAILLKETGAPIEIVYPTEGTPLVIGSAGVLKEAPHPNAARLFISYLFSQEGQQLLVDVGGARSLHPDTHERKDRPPLSQIKLLKADPVEQEKTIDEIKQKYAEYFGT
jgi:iron(III) transport system substrate-binding protein